MKKTDIEIENIKKITKNIGKKINLKGTPPADMTPFKQEWWEICRDENAPGIEHEGFKGCYECFTMCTSHPDASDPQSVIKCGQMFLTDCIVPELQEQIEKFMSYINPQETCSPWTQFDVDTWESETCKDPIACSNECERFCKDQGFNKGICETKGSLYYCNCEL